MVSLKGRSFLKLLDYTPEEIEYLLELAAKLKDEKKKGEGKDDIDVPAEDREAPNQCDADIKAQQDKKDAAHAEYAAGNATISQLVDLALLQNGLLQGEALAKFVERSIDMIGK